MHPTRVLLAVAESQLQATLEQVLRASGHDVVTAGSDAEAVALLRAQKLTCALLDLDLTGRNDLAVIRRIVRAKPSVALIVLGSMSEPETVVSCLQAGALDYLRKPIEAARLESVVARALARARTRRLRQAGNRLLQQELARYTVRLRRARASAARSSLGTLQLLVHVMEARDRYLAGHSVRVAQLAASMAAEMGRSEADIEQVRLAGRLHDIGMLCIEDGILSKMGPLTPEELDRVQQHVVIGDSILAGLPRVEGIRTFIRGHHERWDGRGYPDHLHGEAIAWGAQMLGAAEIYDALTTARPYRAPVAPEQAIDQMRGLSGTAVNPEICEILASIVRQGRALVFLDDEIESRLTSLETGVAFAPPT